MNQTFNISTSTLLRFILIILGLVFLYLIRDILLALFIALIVAAAVDGPVDWLARHGVRRVIGTAIVYVSVLLLFILFVYLVFPPLVGQIKALSANLPQYFAGLEEELGIIQQKIGAENLSRLLEKFSSQLSGFGSNALGAVFNIFGGIFSVGLVLVISIYLVVQDKGIKKFLASVTPPQHQAYVASLTERVQSKLGGWLRGQLVLMAIVGLLVYLGLTLLKVKFALTLALLAGLLEIIPYIGPILGALPAVTLAFFQAPWLGLLVVALFVLIQQIENYLIVPQVMKRVVGLNPLVIILSMVVGGKLAGILGIVVAVPLAAAISVFLSDFMAGRSR